MATPIHTAEQSDYRLAQQCGADGIGAADVAVAYRLEDGARPIERIGGGWREFGIEPGTVLETAEDVEGMRYLMAGRDPHTHARLVKPKVAVAPDAQLPAEPFAAALAAAAEQRGTEPAGLVADAWSAKRIARLNNQLVRDGEHHRAPVADLERVADAAGIELAEVYGAQELAHAQAHRDERVQTGLRGVDVAFDRDKRTSALQAVAPPEMAARMEAIHLESVREAVAALESWTAYGMAGHHGDGQSAQPLATSGFLATMTVHRTARPLDDGAPGDPHLHTHVMIAHLARGTDGTWRTIAAGARDIMRHVPAVGELYRAIEREKLSREFGLVYRQDPKTRRWEPVGVPDRLKAAFSRRQGQIRDAVGEGATPAQQRAAGRSSARAKTTSTPAQERDSWHRRARAAKVDPREVVQAALEGREPGEPTAGRAPEPGPSPRDPDAVAAAVWDPDTGVTAHTKTVTRAKLMAHVAGACGPGLADAQELEELTEHVLADERAVVLPAAGPGHMANAQRYTSADIPAAEQTILEAAEQGRGAGAAVVDRERGGIALARWQKQKGFRLSEGQRQAVGRLVVAGHGLDTLLGVAGAGKTTIMSAARCAWQASGYRVEGAAVAAVAAAGLRAEAGIDSRTVASWTRRIAEGPGLDGVDVLVVDEAAMVGDRDLAALTAEARRTGTKLVLVGDHQQLKSVSAGSVFREVHQRVEGRELHENRRQRREVDQEALATWRTGARRSALAMWGERGMVHAPPDADAAHDQMAAAWWHDRQAYAQGQEHDAVEQLLMVAATNADVDQLNERARAAAAAGGLLEGPGVSFATAGGEHLALAAGDQVRVRRNDYRSRTSGDPDVLNGYRGLVRQVHPERGALVEWRRDGTTEQAWIGPDRLHRGDLTHGYAITIAAAQGTTAQRCHAYGLGADANALYVAMSRARERTDLYLPAVDIEPEEVHQRLGEARTETERAARVVGAYADTLTADEPGLVLEELERQRGREAPESADEQDTEREQEPADEREPAGQGEVRGPAGRQPVGEVRAIRSRQGEIGQELREARQAEQEAAARAAQGRVRLLLAGTSPREARQEHEAARAAVAALYAEQQELRQREDRLRRDARVADAARVREQEAARRREADIELIERSAPTHGHTRAELRAMEPAQLAALRSHTAALARPATTDRPPVRVGDPEPQPTRLPRTPRHRAPRCRRLSSAPLSGAGPSWACSGRRQRRAGRVVWSRCQSAMRSGSQELLPSGWTWALGDFLMVAEVASASATHPRPW